jgi:hypothetical protein
MIHCVLQNYEKLFKLTKQRLNHTSSDLKEQKLSERKLPEAKRLVGIPAAIIQSSNYFQHAELLSKPRGDKQRLRQDVRPSTTNYTPQKDGYRSWRPSLRRMAERPLIWTNYSEDSVKSWRRSGNSIKRTLKNVISQPTRHGKSIKVWHHTCLHTPHS